MTIESTFRATFAHSAELFAEAGGRFPGGITHDGRQAAPFPLYIERAVGAYKWDADGNRLIDYWCGHGSLLLGHSHPAVVAAVQRQIGLGSHYGAGHRLELRWAALVQQLIPGAELVRFTASGSEATSLALRLARAYTRKSTVIRFAGHFHGWHDGIAPGADLEDPHAGLLAGLLGHLRTLPPSLDALADALASSDDVAAVIMEPTGASYGVVPLGVGFLRGARELCTRHGALLICDEVVTGFRLSPGGAQARAGVTADLTSLAKVLAGGLPGGAVAGRAEVMRHLAFGDERWNAERKIRHQGTYNANPLSAAAGVAALELVAGGAPGAAAAERGSALVAALNEVLRAHRLIGWTAYGDGSIFHLFADPASRVEPGQVPADVSLPALKRGGSPRLIASLRMALQIAGVDLMRGRSGFVSAAHSPADLAATAAALDRALGMFRAEGLI